MSVRIKDTDKGYAKRLAAFRAAAKGSGVSVGIHGKEGAKEHPAPTNKEGEPEAAQPLTIADIAAFNEFGLGVPERSFIRAWFDEATDENRTALRNALKMALQGEKTLEQALELVGLRFVGKMQQRISAGIAPENAPSTIQKKGSSKPLIDSGALRAAITYSVSAGPKPPGD